MKIIDNGAYQLAMLTLSGWDKMEFTHVKDLNPASKVSSVINATDKYLPQNDWKVYVTLMLWKKSGEPWTDDELMPIKDMKLIKDGSGVVINLTKNGLKKVLF